MTRSLRAVLLVGILLPCVVGPASEARGPGVLRLIGPGTVELTLPAGAVRADLPTTGGPVVLHVQALDPQASSYSVLVAPGLDPDLRSEAGSPELRAGRYRLQVVGDAREVRLVVPGARSAALRLTPRPGSRAFQRSEPASGAAAVALVALVVRQPVTLPSRGLVWVAGAATHDSGQGVSTVRMGGCVTAPGALCEQQGRVAGRVAVAPAGSDEWVAVTFAIDDLPRAADLGAYFDGSPTMVRASGAFVVVDLGP